ncbi:MAG: tetratricopeptide repeat protein [Ruminococcaceae bacterium]|nr:tetratricopeptide repeat protein [Oscillospiraceae bacterium]
MGKLVYKTRGMTDPKGKPRVYFCCHPDDLALFDSISEDILKKQNCSVWYWDGAPEDPWEDLFQDLSEMQLFVMPITSKLLCTKNRALDKEFPFAKKMHIPVLPLMQETGLLEIFNEKCGKIQYLDKHRVDETAISFEEKLDRYLSSVLIGDELAEKIRAAFDAYVFLSYRKKDRKHAKELMRLIHKNSFCRDIAIWYDEFLTPGENFNDSIKSALEKSQLFVLTVTPNLINEENYIMTTEYPMAVDAGKPILPAELVATDRDILKKKYASIPECTNARDEKALSDALLEAVKKLAIREGKDSPEHNFFIGLAYLDGIDVEIDHERAISLIESAANADVPEACECLVNMYKTGKGVSRDYKKAAVWKGKKVEICKEMFLKEGSEESHRRYFLELIHYGDSYIDIGMESSAGEVFEEALRVVCDYCKKYPGTKSERDASVCFSRLGSLYFRMGSLKKAREYIEKDLEISERLARDCSDYSVRQELSVSYADLGRICEASGDLWEALTYYKKCYSIREQLRILNGNGDSYEDLAEACSYIGDVYDALGDIENARGSYEEEITLLKTAVSEEGTLYRRGNLATAYKKLGTLYMNNGELEKAREFFERSLEISTQLKNEFATVTTRKQNAIDHACIGNVCQKAGDLAGARKYYEISLEMMKALAKETDSNSIIREVSVGCDELGDLYQSEGKYREARRYYEEGKRIREILVKKTDLPNYRRDLAVSVCNLGDIAYDEDDYSSARRYYSECIAITEGIEKEVDTIEARHSLSVAYERLANICFEEQDYEGAKKYRLLTLDIREKIAKESEGISSRTSLAISYVKAGEAVRALEDDGGAYEYYCKSIDILERCAERSSDINVLIWLSYAYERMGNLYIGQIDAENAEIYILKCYNIRKKLLDTLQTPKSVKDLAYSCDKLGMIYKKLGSTEKAKGFYSECIELREKYLQWDGDADVKASLSGAYHWLGDILREEGDILGAQKHIEREVALCEEIFDNDATEENLDSLADTYYEAAYFYFDERRLDYLKKTCAAFEKLYSISPRGTRYYECMGVARRAVEETERILKPKGFFKKLFGKK